MPTYTKSSYTRYLKKVRISQGKVSNRNPISVNADDFTHREFKMVLPMFLKDNVAGKGINTKPSMNKNIFLIDL